MEFHRDENGKSFYKFEWKKKSQLFLIKNIILLILGLAIAGILIYKIYDLLYTTLTYDGCDGFNIGYHFILIIIYIPSITLNFALQEIIDDFMTIWNHYLKPNWKSIDFQSDGIEVTHFHSIKSQYFTFSQIIGYQILTENTTRAGWGGFFKDENFELTIFGDDKKKLFKYYIPFPKNANNIQISRFELEDFFSKKYFAKYMKSTRNILKMILKLIRWVFYLGIIISVICIFKYNINNSIYSDLFN